MDDISKYLVSNPKQILLYLKLLSVERCLISATFGDDKKDTFLTVILDADEDTQALMIDCGPKEYLNKKLLNSAVIQFSTVYKGIKVLFEEDQQVKKSGKIGQPAFSITIPKSLYWIQRREFYRVKPLLSKENYCLIQLTAPKTGIKSLIKLSIYDISANGFSIINEFFEYSALLTPFTTFKNCELFFENKNRLTVSIEIRHKLPLNSNNPNKSERMGCFITNVSSRIESTIICYMQSIEREIKQKQ